MKKRKGLKAWLITWEWCGRYAEQQDKVVEILDPRTSPERVRAIVELLYHREASLSEKVSWRLRKGKQIYPAEITATALPAGVVYKLGDNRPALL